MTDMSLTTTPLAEIDGSYANRDVLAGEISQRLQNGREQEVFDFLRECDGSVLNQLGYASGNLAWETDAATWLALARLTVPRGVLLREGRAAGKQRNDAFSRELCDLAEQYLAGTGAQKDALIFVLRNIIDRLAYPGIPRQRVFNLLEWNLALSRAAG